MAGFSMYSSRDTEGLVTSTNQGLDRCASLLRALLSPTKIKGDSSFPGPSKQRAPLSVKAPPQARKENVRVGGTRAVQTSSDNIRYCSVNKKHLNKKSTEPVTTITTSVKKIERNRRPPILTKDTNKRKRKLCRGPVPVAMSTPQNISYRDDIATKQPSLPVGIYPMAANQEQQPFPPPAASTTIPQLFKDGQYHSLPWPPFMWLPPYYPMVDTRQAYPHNVPSDNNAQLETELTELKTQLEDTQKGLHETHQQVAKCEEEKSELQRQYATKIEILKEAHKREREVLTLKLSKLENGLKDIESHWKEKYHRETELEYQEIREENQMLKLAVAEKETELLQSHDTLLGIRQYLAHLLLQLQQSEDKEWSLLPHKDVVSLQTIVNTGHCIEEYDKATNSSVSITPTQSLENVTTVTTPTKSCSTTGWTTSSEIDFRRDLAALDADIARLQIHFNISHDAH